MCYKTDYTYENIAKANNITKAFTAFKDSQEHRRGDDRVVRYQDPSGDNYFGYLYKTRLILLKNVTRDILYYPISIMDDGSRQGQYVNYSKNSFLIRKEQSALFMNDHLKTMKMIFSEAPYYGSIYIVKQDMSILEFYGLSSLQQYYIQKDSSGEQIFESKNTLNIQLGLTEV